MGLSFKVESLDSVDEPLRGLYAKQTDGSFQLKVQGMPDVKANMSEIERLRSELDVTSSKLKEYGEAEKLSSEAKTKAEMDKAAMTGDLESYKKSMEEKMAKERSEYQATLKSYNNALKKNVLESAAKNLAAELFTAPEAMLPYIMNHLRVDVKDGVAEVKVTDLDGKLTAMSVEDLKQDLRGREALKNVLVGSHANGGGASGATYNGSVSKLLTPSLVGADSKTVFEAIKQKVEAKLALGG